MTGVCGMEEVCVRRATREDVPLIHQMVQELAAFEGVPDGPQLTVDELVADGFEANPAWFWAAVVEVGGQAAGYALLNLAYSSWTGRAAYVEDLYVRAQHRRRGLATALMRHVCEECAARGVTRLDWHVLENNSAALAFYGRLGARDLRRSEGRAALRLDQPRILEVAAGNLLH